MNHSLNVAQPIRYGVRLIAVVIAAAVGLAGHFMENSPQIKELDINNVVEQIHSTLERREAIKLQN